METDTASQGPVSGLRLHNLALAAGDLENTVVWYENVLGFVVTERGRLDSIGANYVMMEASGLRIELVSRPYAEHQRVDRTASPHHIDVLGYKAIVLETDDLLATTSALQRHGVEFVWTNRPLGQRRCSTMLRDPEGNLINIIGPIRAAA
jgi:catechol 2,3-dioxygenase-like lactoylglutathione lyase family enzyme